MTDITRRCHLALIVVSLLIWLPSVAGAQSCAELYKQGFELQKAGKLKGALDTYDRCLESDPEYYNALLAAGTVYYSMQEYQDAASRFGVLLTYYPDDVRGRLYLAYCNLHLGLADEAKDTLERIVADEPKNVSALIALGWAEYLLDNRFTASDFLKQALALHPENKHLAYTIERLQMANERFLQEEGEAQRFRIMSDLNNAIADASIADDSRRLGTQAAGLPEHLTAAEKMVLWGLMGGDHEVKRQPWQPRGKNE